MQRRLSQLLLVCNGSEGGDAGATVVVVVGVVVVGATVVRSVPALLRPSFNAETPIQSPLELIVT